MENCSKQSNKEFTKAAMLKQEEIFRHQVHELHRLYRVQKQFMREMKSAEETDDESNLELTLCTGTNQRRLSTQKAKEGSSDSSGSNFSSSSTESATAKSKKNEWGVIQMPADMSMKFIDQSKNSLDRQDSLKHPPWFFQCLSLNITS